MTLEGEPLFFSQLWPRMPDMVRAFLLLVMIVSGTVTLPQSIGVGETSGLGIWTTVIAFAVWLLWFVRPYFPRELSRILLPLAVFSVYAVLSLTWGGLSVKALQNLSVSVGFAGFVLLTARECERRPGLAFSLHRALDFASIIAAIGYTATVAVYGPGADPSIGDNSIVFAARPFALFAAVAIARQTARWQAGEAGGFWIAIWLLTLVFLSQSRLAMVVCLILFPIAMCCRGDARSIANAVLMTGLAAGILLGSIFFSQSMYDRFFGYDANINVAGVNINSSGRAEMWAQLLDDVHGPAIIFGKGAGGAGLLIDRYFPRLGHPHNDFLRFFYDFGLFGLGWWILFVAVTFAAMLSGVRRCADKSVMGVRGRRDAIHPEMVLYLTPLLALFGITASMFTDNSVSYVFVMAPLGMLIGAALSRLRISDTSAPLAAAPGPGVRLVYLPNWENDTSQGPGSGDHHFRLN